MKIRGKLLLASLSLLIVPWLGFQHIQNLKDYLHISHEEKLLDRLSIMATVINAQPQLMPAPDAGDTAHRSSSHLYIRSMEAPVQLDGYLDDWRLYESREAPLGPPDGDLQVLVRTGIYLESLHIALNIKDNNIIYRTPGSLHHDQSDHIQLSMIDKSGRHLRYQLSAITPGEIKAYSMPAHRKVNNNPRSARPELRIKGAWQPAPGGYTVELSIPRDMIDNRFSMAVIDIDDKASRIVNNTVSSSSTDNREIPGTIIFPEPAIESLLTSLKTTNSRIWIVDSHHRVLGIGGRLKRHDDEAISTQTDMASTSLFSVLIKLFYRLTLGQPNNDFTDTYSASSKLDNPAITAALNGTPYAHWRETDNQNIKIIFAAQPVYINERITGAIAIEENSNNILLLQNRVIEAMINMSIIAFLLTTGVLLLFATRLSLRIHRLRNEVDASISDDGQIQQVEIHNSSGDEIGDLGRSFSTMLNRLSQYNRYLETMSGKLSHEIRTPITIVRSSLDNLNQSHLDQDNITYLKRANEGLARLNNILTRMSEATHLEQTILYEQRTNYHPTEVIQACLAGYQLAYPEHRFKFNCDKAAAVKVINGSPELLAQLMDKLVDNATDFAQPETPITMTISNTDNELSIAIHNQGPPLPAEMRESLFDSMVSIRQHKSDEAHLGLGLYIVRLITDFHHAKIDAQNTSNPPGVTFTLTIPLSSPENSNQ